MFGTVCLHVMLWLVDGALQHGAQPWFPAWMNWQLCLPPPHYTMRPKNRRQTRDSSFTIRLWTVKSFWLILMVCVWLSAGLLLAAEELLKPPLCTTDKEQLHFWSHCCWVICARMMQRNWLSSFIYIFRGSVIKNLDFVSILCPSRTW